MDPPLVMFLFKISTITRNHCNRTILFIVTIIPVIKFENQLQ